ncbi:hypothetical protein [Thiolapillus sp.]|uniref:hypothetical protein n=1 Tax=Thiolapillus sp. TaxID=2017437 RepID=UPI003AF7650E
MKNEMKNELDRVVIISGEGEVGIIEPHTGRPTKRAVRARLTRERCCGDRWAKAIAYVDGTEGFDVETGEPADWTSEYDIVTKKH